MDSMQQYFALDDYQRYLDGFLVQPNNFQSYVQSLIYLSHYLTGMLFFLLRETRSKGISSAMCFYKTVSCITSILLSCFALSNSEYCL